MAQVLKFAGTQIGDLAQRATLAVRIAGGAGARAAVFRQQAIVDEGASPNVYYELRVWVSIDASDMGSLIMWTAAVGRLATLGKNTVELSGGDDDFSMADALMTATPEVPVNFGRHPGKALEVMLEFISDQPPVQ